MRDLVLIIFILGFVVASFRRPYFMALGYIWVDFLQPQKLTYLFLNSAPVALFMALGAVAFFVFLDQKKNARIGALQVLFMLFALYATANTFGWAMLSAYAIEKWDWVWKGLAFAAFLPLVLTTRRRIEAATFVMVLSTAAITISAGIKTLLGSGGYGNLAFLVNNNTGLYEGSTLATVALSFIPLTLWLYKHNSLIRPSLISALATAGLIVSMLLVTIGSEARTGLLAGGVLAVLLWLGSRRKLVLAAAMAATFVVAVPFLPASFTERMSTIKSFDEDESASTRLAVWKWTIDFTASNPLGGGFGVYRINEINVETTRRKGEADNTAVSTVSTKQQARAFHNSFFEVLGELGYPGVLIYLVIIALGLRSAWSLRKATTGTPEDDVWFRDLGKAMTASLLVYFTGSMFVGIAFQPPYYDLLAIVIAAQQVARRSRMASAAGNRIGPKPSRATTGMPLLQVE